MILKVIFTVIASLVFLYCFWKKLKDDYTTNQIFSVGFYILFGIFTFSILAANFAHAWTFWLSFLGSIFGLAIGITRFKLRTFEVTEGWVFGGLGLTWVFYVYTWIGSFSLRVFAPVIAIFVFIFLYQYLDSRYRRFTWYKSGRIGFAGMATLGVFFLVRAVVALFYPNMLFFVGKSDIIISCVVSFTAFFILFNLSRKEA